MSTASPPPRSSRSTSMSTFRRIAMRRASSGRKYGVASRSGRTTSPSSWPSTASRSSRRRTSSSRCPRAPSSATISTCTARGSGATITTATCLTQVPAPLSAKARRPTTVRAWPTSCKSSRTRQPTTTSWRTTRVATPATWRGPRGSAPRPGPSTATSISTPATRSCTRDVTSSCAASPRASWA